MNARGENVKIPEYMACTPWAHPKGTSCGAHPKGTVHLGPAGIADDIMGPDGYRASLLFQAGMPELRNDPRFVRLCARLGLVEFWFATGKWPDCAHDVNYDFESACENVRHIPKQEFGF